MRPFKDAHEMDSFLESQWNKTVSPNDKVYLLGDVTLDRKNLSILDRLHGRKVLVMGNHDVFPMSEYMRYFKDVYGYYVLSKNILLSHIPVHASSKYRYKANVHAHVHQGCVQIERGGVMQPDPFYLNVSAEEVGYTPVSIEELLQRVTETNRIHS